jgi:hypothetical protein
VPPNYFMKKSIFFILLLNCLFVSNSIGQNTEKHTISGTIKDAKNGEELIGASIVVSELKSGVLTNAYGFYSLNIPSGKYKVSFSYLGYATIVKEIDLANGNVKMNIELTESNEELGEVVISDDKPDAKNVEQNKMSVVKMDMKQVKRIPILLGEVDIIKAIQLLPGIQAAGDGNTLFIVRGGNVDHNLVLLDEAVVYNPSHVVGFFSVFNGDAIKDFEVYKGGIPSNYGGRLASVLDVRMKDGNSKKFSASGGIGLLSSRLTLEGPLQKNKSSFMISARRSYFDLFIPLAPETNIRDAKAFFGDLNIKLNYELNDKNKIYLSAYGGKDVFKTGNLFGLGWGNNTGTIRWNHIFNTRLFSNTSFIISRYNYNFEFNLSPNLNLQRKNFIRDYSLKQDFNYFANAKNTFKFGFLATYHIFSPGEIKPITKESIIAADKLREKYALDYSVYGSHSIKVNSRFTMDYGLRISMFQNIGSGRYFKYANNQPNYVENGFLTASPIMDTVNVKSGSIYNTVFGLEPRFNATYLLNSSSSIKLSYNRMFQYMHLIQPTNASTGQEFWTPTDNYIKPQRADQIATGYFKNFRENTIELSGELYYKWMNNTVELIDNADVQFREDIETQVLAGIGRAYGLELMARKQRGRTTGWLAYTLSKSERKAEGVNNNEWYNFRFDRTHYITAVLSHDLTNRVSLSGNFIFATGDSYTPAVAYFEYEGERFVEYGKRNGARVPSYHRMDVSLTIGRKIIPGKVYKNESNWVFSVYNVYGRKNPYSIDFITNEVTGRNQAQKTYLFSIIPSVTYNFKF